MQCKHDECVSKKAIALLKTKGLFTFKSTYETSDRTMMRTTRRLGRVRQLGCSRPGQRARSAVGHLCRSIRVAETNEVVSPLGSSHASSACENFVAETERGAVLSYASHTSAFGGGAPFSHHHAPNEATRRLHLLRPSLVFLRTLDPRPYISHERENATIAVVDANGSCML